jgi:hypothetical protein
MSTSFTPSFQDFQKDIERLLKSKGQVEKNALGQTVFRGYPAALAEMFRLYIDEGALAPLVADVRKWNWEWSYSEYLLELTSRLQEKRDWPLLKALWVAVVAKRRTNYNKTRKAQKSVPDKIPDELVTKTQRLLLESLDRLQGYASELGQAADVTEYVEMTARVEQRRQA